jgi:hypothetical protein
MSSAVELAAKGKLYIYDLRNDEFRAASQLDLDLLMVQNQYYGRFLELFSEIGEYDHLKKEYVRLPKKGVRNLSKKLLELHNECRKEVVRFSK